MRRKGIGRQRRAKVLIHRPFLVGIANSNMKKCPRNRLENVGMQEKKHFKYKFKEGDPTIACCTQ
jgi:hypothetical protein